MTILIKNGALKNPPAGLTLVPLVPQRQVKLKRVRKPAPASMGLKSSTGAFLFISMITLAVVVLSFTSGVLLFKEYIRGNSLRYRGRCAISSTKDTDYIVLNDAPTKPWFGVPAAQMKVFSSPSDLISSRVMHQLLEDMAIEDSLETITVRDGQRAFEIVHDFDDNLTSIRADERCFIMDMIHDFVLEPSSLIASFHNESRLDLSHAHSFFRAQLPALSAAVLADADLARNCFVANKPVYRLNLEDSLVVRKRSVAPRTTEPPMQGDDPDSAPASDSAPAATDSKRDFVQFSGKHLQRITISNMDDVIHYERNAVKPHPKLRAAN